MRHSNPNEARALAYAELEGVGDAALGQWEERFFAFHLRRRLSEAEQQVVGPAVDIRGSKEEWRRYKTLPASVRKAVGQLV